VAEAERARVERARAEAERARVEQERLAAEHAALERGRKDAEASAARDAAAAQVARAVAEERRGVEGDGRGREGARDGASPEQPHAVDARGARPAVLGDRETPRDGVAPPPSSFPPVLIGHALSLPPY